MDSLFHDGGMDAWVLRKAMGKALGEQKEALCGGGEQAMQEKGMKRG